MNNYKIIFVHGGPGLNSEPERNLIKQSIEDKGFNISFWDEPRNFTTENCYLEIINDLSETILSQDKQVCLIGHSFGCSLILDTLSKTEKKISSLLFLSPVLDSTTADMKIITHSLNILKNNNPELAKELKEKIPKLTEKFNDLKADATVLAFQSGYFVENFINQESFDNYFQFFQGPNEFRVEDYIKIRKSKDKFPFPTPVSTKIPLLSIFGEKDPIINCDHETTVIKKHFKNSQFIKLESISHYPHIDSKEAFIIELEKLVNAI